MKHEARIMKYGHLLGIRTDSAEASVILFSSCHPEEKAERFRSGPLDCGSSEIQIIDRTDWAAGRQLSATLLATVEELFKQNNLDWSDLSGIVVYEGPGSFTGLRIGITVANTAAFTLNIPIVGATGDDWLEQGSRELKSDYFEAIVMPAYGAEANIGQPKH